MLRCFALKTMMCWIGLHREAEPAHSTLERVARELDAALSTIGFVYLKNHGIADHLVSSRNLVTFVNISQRNFVW